MTYLEICQELCEELGIGGADAGSGIPSAVTGNVGPLARAARWVKKANQQVIQLQSDWAFMWAEYQETQTVGVRTVTAHSGSDTVLRWRRDSLWLSRDTDEAIRLRYMPWSEFRVKHLPGTHTTNTLPTVFTIKPDNSLLMNEPFDTTYTMDAEFYKSVNDLAANEDVSDIPADYHRLIVVAAGMRYAGKEGAGELIDTFEGEYHLLLQSLRNEYLPAANQDGMSEEDVDLTVTIPGFEREYRG